MKKFTSVWHDKDQRRVMTETAVKWALWQILKEVLRHGLELWLQT
ncbi:hypothetical protein ACFCWY_06780 [Streptomyces sp. NPDC056362]